MYFHIESNTLIHIEIFSYGVKKQFVFLEENQSIKSNLKFSVFLIQVNATIIASVFSCFTTLTVIIYASMTLEYGEKYEESKNVSYNHPHIVSSIFCVSYSPLNSCSFINLVHYSN